MPGKIFYVSIALVFCLSSAATAYQLGPHPRILVNSENLPLLAERAGGVLSEEYRTIKAEADRAVAQGVKNLESHFAYPLDLVSLGICYLIERELGGAADKYAEAVKRFWGDGRMLDLDGEGAFGYYALLYDWIYDALSATERKTYGDILGRWLRHYTDSPEITLKSGHWWYNQTWCPAHLNTPHCRDGITPKLFVSLALAGAGTVHEQDARRFLDSWAKRVPGECIPAFDEMGGVWSESMGHGTYGPVVVIPWAFEAWRTATGEDLFQAGSPSSFLPEMIRWAIHLTVPFNDHTACIDDNRGDKLKVLSRVAPILGARYRDPVANAISAQDAREGWNENPWYRFLSYDPSIKPNSPGGVGYPLSHLFKGAGHVYMRSAWDDPDATWAFFGAGPKFAGHSRDDEGHFLIAKKGWLVMRIGGLGGNEDDLYCGGSLAFNLVTIYDPDEQFRRVDKQKRANGPSVVKNENDGGLIRYVYSSNYRDDRAEIKAYQHDNQLTYAAADITQGYSASKNREVTRQFLYLRGQREFFIIFDRVHATSPDFPKTWFLHMPGEPEINGNEKVVVLDHVYSYNGNTATWLSDPAGLENVLSTGRSRAFLKTLLPKKATIVKRGGKGHDFWGNPHEPTAQYNHTGKNSYIPPIVPWRLEVEEAGNREREYYLHVLEIGEENDKSMSAVSLIDRNGLFGARIDSQGTPVEVLFTRQGPMSARIRIGNAAERVLGQ